MKRKSNKSKNVNVNKLKWFELIRVGVIIALLFIALIIILKITIFK